MTDKSTKKKNIPVETEAAAEDMNVPQTDEVASDNTTTDETSGMNQFMLNVLTIKEQEAAQDRDRLLRLSAEFDNYKKRMSRQMDDFKKYANETLLKDLLNVVDNLERASTTSAGTTEPSTGVFAKESLAECVREGVEMTLSEVIKILNQYHVTAFEALGKPFDPAYHEAVMQEASDQPENTVIRVFQKGYLLHDRLLRPAMVVVSKKQ